MLFNQRFLTLLLALWLWTCVYTSVLAADSNAWRSRNIYFALTDRFARNTSSSTVPCGNLSDYCGGTFAGLQSKLDYIKGMGFDAVWITPVVTNSPGGYHGYWAQDLNSINSHLGTADELDGLVRAAHSKNMYVMVDVVANHMSNANIQDNKPAPMNQDNSFHYPCTINYSDQGSIEYCRIANDIPDVNTQSAEIRSLYQSWIKSLVSRYNFDGIRVDTVKHVEKDYWPDFVSAAGVYAIGEVFDGNPDYLASYQSVMPGLLNYAIYYPLNNVFQQKGSFQDLVNTHDAISAKFPDPTLLGTFLDNHDNPRFLSQKNDVSLFKNALAYVILARGIPIVYYGTEQGFNGGNDPNNREDLWRTGYNTNSDLYKTISAFSSARTAAGGLGGNDHVHLYVDSSGYAWSRAGGALIVLTTNIGFGNNGRYCIGSRMSSGTEYNVVAGSGSGRSYAVLENGDLCLDVSNGEPVVLLRN